MRFLLDTHVFIWLDIAQNRLSPTISRVIQDESNELYLSLVSIWEMQVKLQIGKLQLNASLIDTLRIQQDVNRIQQLPISVEHILALGNLPQRHRDPFDRLLIAQA
ncbi:MAG: type II toxin-antitoxin system VapC family toxin [Anaerolineae bacterium]|nr:type II toxin-antitoxin system VapC family toxin [Anaerolineae bacterium]